MDEELGALAARVRLDAGAFGRDVAELKGLLADGLGAGADAAARGIETALKRAARTGRLEFEDLAKVAARALGEIAGAALKLGTGGGAGGLGGALAGAAVGLLGLPGRATGGPVSPGRAYVVGERGPELFVPTASGRVEPGRAGGSIQVTVNVAAPREASRQFMSETGRQVAARVGLALARARG